MNYKWNIEKKNNREDRPSHNGYSPVVTNILKNRGFSTIEQINAFFFPSLKTIASPFLMKDMKKAAKRVADAVQMSQKIMIFGDYDADGVTSTAILYNFLSTIGAKVSWYIPHRVKEGYSLKKSHVHKIFIPESIDLVITVDCGSDSLDAAAELKEQKIDLIITDHHTVSGPLPEACAFVNPLRPDCTSGLSYLAGVGVAFYLLIALRTILRERHFFNGTGEPNLKDYCDIVAIGTVGDIVPLIAENRVFTKTGLDIMGSKPAPGIAALAKAAKINTKTFNSDDIAFRLAPRINAAGRMDHAETALNLLIETQKKQSEKYSIALNHLNTARQTAESAIFDEIISYIEEHPEELDKKSLIFARQGWNPGIVGIIASKLVNRYDRPVILIALDGTHGKASGRSIPAINLYQALESCNDVLTSFGGHTMAAGLSIKSSDIKAFREKFEDYVVKNTKEEDFFKTLHIESSIEFDDITPKLLDDLERFQPFGASNQEPLFIAGDVSVISSSIVGKSHKRIILSQQTAGSGQKIAGIHFNCGGIDPYPVFFKNLVFKLRWNKWNNSKSPQIIIEDYES